MAATITFFASLLGIILLIGFKVFELSYGVKPFSSFRYKLDAIIHDRTERVIRFAGYFNRETGKLLLLFVLSELKDLAIALLRRIEETKVGETVRGRNIPSGNGSGTNSSFLKEMSEMKNGVKGEGKEI